MPRRKTYQEFEAEAAEVHGGKYTYHQDYVNSYTKVKITCPEHGDFYQNPRNHLIGAGCPKCGKIKSTNARTDTYKDFEKKAKAVHGEKYIYHQDYVNSRTKVTITCPKHGEFKKIPNDHTQGGGCPRCSVNSRKSVQDFEHQARLAHGGKYQYSQDYVNNRKKIKILCPKHGIFKQAPKDHLKGDGCPSCRRSLGEERVAKFLEQKDYVFWDQHSFDECRHKKRLSFDFYLPNYRICIEYQGKQHYEIARNNFFGGEEALKERQRRDQIKRDYCKKKGIILVEIPYHKELIATRILGAITQRKREREENPIQQKSISTDWGQAFIFGEQLDLFNRPQTSP